MGTLFKDLPSAGALAANDRVLIRRGTDLLTTELSNVRKLIRPGSIDRVLPASNFFPTWLDQGDSTLMEESNYGLVLDLSANTIGTTAQIRGIVKTLPAEPWTITVGVVRGFPLWRSYSGGLILRDSVGGKIQMAGFPSAATGNVAIRQYNSTTAFSTTLINQILTANQRAFFRVTNDGTNLKWEYSHDGLVWRWLTTVAKTSFYGRVPDQWGIGIDAYKNSSGDAAPPWIKMACIHASVS